MNTLHIEQGSTVEIVSAELISKLYRIVSSIPQPQEGDDSVYLSGSLIASGAESSEVSYLVNRCPNLIIST